MTELDILKHAKNYIDDMAKGKNPLTGEDVPDTDLVQNVRISRCLFYVSSVLEKVIQNGGEVQKKSSSKKPNFTLTQEELANFTFFKNPVPISTICSEFERIATDQNTKKLKATDMTKWLMELGFLTVINDGEKVVKKPTDNGTYLGISVSKKWNHDHTREYEVVEYNESAQHFLVDHFADFIAFRDQNY